jgi:hydroxymethylpyrimidine pyrophosphatase-like HAD family hydrolase
MFAEAKYSYAVENASAEVKEQAANIAESAEKQGVIRLLQRLVDKLEQEAEK